MVTIFAWIAKISLKESLIKFISISVLANFALAATLFKAPSNSLTFDLTCCAIKKAQSSGKLISISSAFCRRIAVLVSRAGGSITTESPHPKRDFSLSSRPSISLGYLSHEKIIMFPLSIKLLKVWNSSSCDCSLPAKNCISSISRALRPL